jgi:hypothetical protein
MSGRGDSERESARFLAAYDDQLRTQAEVDSADEVVRIGPLWVATYASRGGFVTYRDLGGADSAEIDELVARALEHFSGRADVAEIEWKTRGHDEAPGLHESLVARGFEPDEMESVMIGRASDLAADVPLPEGVTLRLIASEADIRAMVHMQNEVFGSSFPADGIIADVAAGRDLELWVAEAAGAIVSSGRLQPVAGTSFAGIWGGATREEWRGRGIYRALTAARARGALARGLSLIQSDSTEYSRPILERSGFVKVTTTTPYVWRASAG